MPYDNKKFTEDLPKILEFLANLHPLHDPNGDWEKLGYFKEEVMQDIKKMAIGVYNYIRKHDDSKIEKKQ